MLRCFGPLAVACLLIDASAAVAADQAVSASPITYYGQIAPIVLQDCAPCHRPGESGPFSLLTYEDVKKRGAQIAKVTGSRFSSRAMRIFSEPMSDMAIRR